MAAGTVTVHGPYPTDGTGVAAALSAAGGGAVIKTLTSWQDIQNKQVWFAVCTEA